jgi:hypothetical protein
MRWPGARVSWNSDLLIDVVYGPTGASDIMGRYGNLVPFSRNRDDVATGKRSELKFDWEGEALVLVQFVSISHGRSKRTASTVMCSAWRRSVFWS